MKRIIPLLLLVCICLSVVSCQKEINNDISSSNSLSESTEESQNESLQESDKITLPKDAKSTDLQGLYKLEHGIFEYSTVIDVSVNEDVVWFEYITPGMDSSSVKIISYSLSTGDVLGELLLEDGEWETGVLDNGEFYVISLMTSELFFYDEKCEQTKHESLFKKIDIQHFASLSPDGKYMLYNSQDGKLVIYTFETSDVSEIAYIGYITPIGFKDRNFYFKSNENIVFRFSLDKKALEEVFNDNEISFVSTEREIHERNSYFVFTDLDDTAKQKMTETQSNQESIIVDNGFNFVTYEENSKESIVRLYDILSGTSYVINIDGNVLKAEFCDNDILLLITENKTDESLLYYVFDKSRASEYENIEILDVDNSVLNNIPEWIGDQKTVELAQNILDTYGVRVIYGDVEISTDVKSYTWENVSENDVFAKLQCVYETLAYFPDGMTKEIGNGEEVWVYLCKKLNNPDNDMCVLGLSSSSLGRIPLILLDAECTDELFKGTLVHEMAHKIDTRVEAQWLYWWEKLLPEDIRDEAYFNSYNAVYDNDFTPYDNGETEVWFYDNYSRTFPTEDRAVLFEKMYESYLGGELTDIFAQNENLRKKARFYCVMLRENFESCKNEDTLPWEELFGEIDLDEFELDIQDVIAGA